MSKQIVPIFKFAAIVLIVIGSAGTRPAAAQTPSAYDPSVCANDTSGKPLSEACQSMITAFPRPIVQDIQQDKATLSRYSFWRVGPDAVATYDAPNGSVTGEIPRGYNFVNVIDQSVAGWLKTQDGKWIKRETAKPTQPSFFQGVTFTDGLKYPFAWVLDKSTIYTSEYPGGPASSKTQRYLKRYERVNLFASAKDDQGWLWYMIGPNQWVKQTFLATAQRIEKPKDVSGRWVAVDLYEQTLVAYEDDTPVYATLVSSGLPQHATHEGLFKVWAKLERDGMSGATGAPSAYALQSVPWVMYFDGGISLHGTYWHDLFGYRQSHGCVNLSISDAHYLFQWMAGATPDQDGQIVNAVWVYSSGKYGNGVIRQ